MNEHRMEAEVVRDSILYLAGKLDPAMGGPDLDPETAESAGRRSLYFNTRRRIRRCSSTYSTAPTRWSAIAAPKASSRNSRWPCSTAV
jgi:hypothetical protein